MNTISFWEGTSQEVPFPSLSQELEADVVIVGGGITGITSAMLLSHAEKGVVVLEAMRIGLGTTGYSTGNLYTTVDSYLFPIRVKWGRETATAVARSRNEMIDLIERTVAEYKISCNFFRRPHYIFPIDDSQVQLMEQEYQAVREAGLDATIVHNVPLPFPVSQSLKIGNQAQFHPLTYVRMLAKAIASDRCRIFEDSRVVKIDYDQKIVSTAKGKVRAKKIILATHTPKGFDIVQTELGPYREYGLAARLKDDRYPEGIFWTMEVPSHSIRSYDVDGEKYLIVIGEKHKTGQHDNNEDYYQKVEDFARSHFNVSTVEYRWSAQHYRPADNLPYVGKSVSSDDVYIATGFGTNGLIYGTLAATIITDDIVGRKNPWEDLYSARRFTPAKSAKDFIKENVNVAKQYVKDYLTRADIDKLQNVKPGEGALVEIDGETLAVYSDEDNQLTVLSPVCTHLGCIVHWNRLERSWDCPCHGSRFRWDGEVIEGPAIAALERKRIQE